MLVLADFLQESGRETEAAGLRRLVKKRRRVLDRLAQRNGEPTKRIRKKLSHFQYELRCL